MYHYATHPAGASFQLLDFHTLHTRAQLLNPPPPLLLLLQVDPSARLTMEDFQQTRTAALAAVRVPQHVIQLLADLRSFLQEKIEPPVYVSDRRLVKAVALMQVRQPCCLIFAM
jgi:hypothetical protein